jgi:cytochrome c biogenesis protein CcmG, thiol:disulfide interchange protein DsbE
MTRARLQRCLYLFFLVSFVSASVAVAQRTAPQFSVATLDGGTVSNSSYSGQLVLLQFWTTWCPYCHRDQPALDNIQAAYASKGLAVLAIDVGEDEATVQRYLQANPRACQIALDKNHSAASSFGASGFPHYVLIDRQGNIAGMASGAGGEAALRRLVSRGDATAKPDTVQSASRGTSVGAGAGIPQWIDVPAGPRSTISSKPTPKTVFVFANGEQFESEHYTMSGGYLDVMVAGQDRHIALNTLDAKKTIAMNHARGVDLQIPATKSEIFLGF